MSTIPFITGATGIGTGAHLDARLWDPERKAYINPEPFLGALLVDDQPVHNRFPITSRFGLRTAPVAGASTDHKGIDIGTPEGTSIRVRNGRWLSTINDPSAGVMATYDWETEDGSRPGGKRLLQWRLLHGSRDNAIGQYRPPAPVLPPPPGQPASVPGAQAPGAQAPAPLAPATLAATSAPPASATVETPAPPDWRAAAADPNRSTDPLDPRYWQREDIKQWAAANAKLAAPLQQAAAFRPVDRGALNGTRRLPTP